ncbi:hypothetical protein SAMN05444396_10444 [Flavobacterium segetis]|uniref:DUF6265 domain-containing protein n=1 Tax=Flavobacterium segetis TaxID=271157 RepID=A0A1M5GNB9_9FLAO|nr:DUF6265 family protein [Flavobacterium segetis]SHG05196.1 hypothetical protein SAMN05444396_10444 [Flavobacterium segetis]
MKNTIVVSLIVLSFVACKDANAGEKDKIKLAHDLLGKWENKSVDGTLTENWTKVNDSTFEATSYFIKNKDTLHFEFISLQQKTDELTYHSTIKGQSGDKPVVFNLIVSDEKQLVFANLKQDYPQKIIYKQLSKNNVVVEISGVQQGKPSAEKYTMIKLK